MRFRRALVAAALTFGLLATGAPAAQADDVDPPVDYSYCQLSNGKLTNGGVLVVGNTHERSIQAYLRASDCPDFAEHYEDVTDSGEPHPYLLFADDVGGDLWSDDGDPSDVFGDISTRPEWLRNSIAGKKLKGTVYLPDGTMLPFPGPKLVIKRKLVMDYVAVPSKMVKKNKSFYIGSYMNRANWDKGDYTAFGKKEVRVEFRPSSGGKWKTIKKAKSVETEFEGGRVETKVKVSKAGCLRLVSDATSTTAEGMSDEVCVKVKK